MLEPGIYIHINGQIKCFFIFLAFSLPSLSKFIFKHAKFYSQKLLSSGVVSYKHLFGERGAAD